MSILFSKSTDHTDYTSTVQKLSVMEMSFPCLSPASRLFETAADMKIAEANRRAAELLKQSSTIQPGSSTCQPTL